MDNQASKELALRGLAMIADRLEATKSGRDDAILRASAAGAKPAEIARAAKMSRQGVSKFLKKCGNSVDNVA